MASCGLLLPSEGIGGPDRDHVPVVFVPSVSERAGGKVWEGIGRFCTRVAQGGAPRKAVDLCVAGGAPGWRDALDPVPSAPPWGNRVLPLWTGLAWAADRLDQIGRAYGRLGIVARRQLLVVVSDGAPAGGAAAVPGRLARLARDGLKMLFLGLKGYDGAAAARACAAAASPWCCEAAPDALLEDFFDLSADFALAFLGATDGSAVQVATRIGTAASPVGVRDLARRG